MIEMSGKRKSKKSKPAVQHDDDADDDIILQ